MSILLQHNSGRSSLLFVNYFFAKTTLQQPWCGAELAGVSLRPVPLPSREGFVAIFI